MRGLKQREYPLGFQLKLEHGKDDGRFGDGTPLATITLELVEMREGCVYVCSDSFRRDTPFCLNWFAAEERHYMLSWGDTLRRSMYDELTHDRRFGGTSRRISAQEALKLGKTLDAIEKAVMKAQDKTQLSTSNFEGYLRNLLVAMKPDFIVDHQGNQRKASDFELVLAYRSMVTEIEGKFAQAVERAAA